MMGWSFRAPYDMQLGSGTYDLGRYPARFFHQLHEGKFARAVNSDSRTDCGRIPPVVPGATGLSACSDTKYSHIQRHQGGLQSASKVSAMNQMTGRRLAGGEGTIPVSSLCFHLFRRSTRLNPRVRFQIGCAHGPAP